MSVVFNPGDKVRLTRGDEAVNGVIKQVTSISEQWVETDPDVLNMSVQWWLDHGWAIAPVAPPKPELPTEKGHFEDERGDLWDFDGDNFWSNLYTAQDYPLHGEAVSPSLFEHTFTRIDSRESWRASWANEIADWLREEPYVDGPNTAANRIVHEFGGAVVDE